MKYSFDDTHIGLTETNNTLVTRLIPRPAGIAFSDWCNFAGQIIKLLNAQINPDLPLCINDYGDEFQIYSGDKMLYRQEQEDTARYLKEFFEKLGFRNVTHKDL